MRWLFLGLNLHSVCDLKFTKTLLKCRHLHVMHPMLMQSMTCELSPQLNFIPSFLFVFFLSSSSISICLSKFLILSSSIFAGPYNFTLSANLISIFSTALCKSLMRTLNRAGSRTDSCGILPITFFQLDREMLITILGIQLTNSEESHLV